MKQTRYFLRVVARRDDTDSTPTVRVSDSIHSIRRLSEYCELLEKSRLVQEFEILVPSSKDEVQLTHFTKLRNHLS